MQNYLSWAFLAAGVGLASLSFAGGVADHLVLSEIGKNAATNNEGEYVEIYNPTASAISLANYWVTDYRNYDDIVTAPSGMLTMASNDNIVRFPSGATLQPGQVAVVCGKGTTFLTQHFGGSLTTYQNQNPSNPPLLFELTESDAGIPNVVSKRSANPEIWNFTNAAEFVTLFWWDGSANLLKDVDMVCWAATNPTSADAPLMKSYGDVGLNGAVYLQDAGTLNTYNLPLSDHYTRTSLVEVGESTNNGNGITGHDESLEYAAAAWTGSLYTVAPAGTATPGTVNFPSGTVVEVDGVGGAPGKFATISAAIQSLGASGADGLPDTINVTADVLDNHPAILINGTNAVIGSWPILTDDISINGNADGNANNCRLALGANIGALTGVAVTTSRIAIELGITQNVTIKDFTIIPHTLGAGGGSIASTAIVIDEGTASSIFNNAGLNLENCVFTASANASNTPLPTGAASTGTPTFFAGEGTNALAAYLSFQSQVTGANRFTHTLVNCTFAHGRFDNVWVGADATATGTGAVFFTDCVSARCVQAGLGDGVNITSADNTTIVFTRTILNNNDEHGLYAIQSVTANVNVTNIILNSGCQLISNSFRGIGMNAVSASVTGKHRLKIQGTPSSPVLLASNSNRGVRFDGSAVAVNQIESVDNLVMRSNLTYGWEFNEADMTYPTATGPLFSNCIFYRNGNLSPYFATFDVQDTNATAGGIRFDKCTFHEAGSAINQAGAHLLSNSTAVTNFTWGVTNSIFSGTNDGDFVVGKGAAGANVVYDISNCALVREGVYSLHANDSTGTAVAAINKSNIITADPKYQSVTVGNANFVKVRNGLDAPYGYATAASGGVVLSGGAAFVGDLASTTLAAADTVGFRGASFNVTAGVFPLTITITNPKSDPNGIDPDGIRDVRDTTQYWDVSFSAGANAVASLTLPWPTTAGFTDGGIYHYSSSDSRWLYGPVTNGSGTPGTPDLSGNPYKITHTDISNFSPFSVGSVGSTPVGLSEFSIE